MFLPNKISFGVFFLFVVVAHSLCCMEEPRAEVSGYSAQETTQKKEVEDQSSVSSDNSYINKYSKKCIIVAAICVAAIVSTCGLRYWSQASERKRYRRHFDISVWNPYYFEGGTCWTKIPYPDQLQPGRQDAIDRELQQRDAQFKSENDVVNEVNRLLVQLDAPIETADQSWVDNFMRLKHYLMIADQKKLDYLWQKTNLYSWVKKRTLEN